MKNFNDLTFEEEEEQKEIIAKTIWGNAFLSGIQKLNKTQLIILINELSENLDFYVNINGDWEWDERDFKDKAFDQKCLMIECVKYDFFKKEEKWQELEGENE